MDWRNSIGRIVLLNLPHRSDRLLDSAEILFKYEIPFERISAVYNKEHGATGLRDTMVRLFEEEIEKKTDSVLVFEDDIKFVEDPESFHATMNAVMEQLPETYHLVFLGCQLTVAPSHFYSRNLIPVVKAFSTHAVLYSFQGMKEILASNLQGPIDNHYVDHIENKGHCYCTYPLLASQRSGYSDIGMAEFDWGPFIVPRYDQKIGEMRAR